MSCKKGDKHLPDDFIGTDQYRQYLTPETLARLEAYEKREPMPPYTDGRPVADLPSECDCPYPGCVFVGCSIVSLRRHIAWKHRRLK